MKLGTVAKVQGGYAFKSQEFQSEGVPIIRIGNLDGKNVEVDNDVCYPITFWDKHPEFRVEKNNILIAMSGATVGKIGLYESDEKALLNQRVCILKPDGKDVTNDYLYFFCLSPTFKNAIKENAFGCAQPNISATQICDFEINVPDIKDQEKWVCELRKIKNIIDKREQEIVELDNLIKSRFVEMFGDPVSNPRGWNIASCKEISSKIGSGATPKGGRESYGTEGITLIRSMNVYNNKFEYKDLAYITDEQAHKLDNVIIEENDVLLNITGASVARCCMVPSKLIPARVNQHVAIIRCKSDVLPAFVSYMLTNASYQRLLWNIATSGGATREAITKQQIEQLQFIVPPITIQQEFVQFAIQVDKLKFWNTKNNRYTIYKGVNGVGN